MARPRTWKGLSILVALALVLALGIVALAPPMVVTAAIIQVTNNSDSGAGSLRQAIGAALPGDEITFAPTVTGTITLTSGQLPINKNLTITGPGAGTLTVSGNNVTRVFFMGGSANVTVSGLTIADGVNGMAGGGIYNEGVVTINNCTVRGNHADANGGGIYNSGSVTLNNCTVTSNTAVLGGGILNFEGTVTLNNCTASGNNAQAGGGILNDSGTATLNNCTASGNNAQVGGGICNSGTATLNNCTVSNNTADMGGGIVNVIGTATLNNCTVSNNTARGDGGGIINDELGTSTLDNCTVSNNTARYAGGGIYNNSTATLNHCTVSGNNAEDGGGILNYAVANVKNSIIARNNAAIWGSDFYGALNSYGCNLVQDTSYCTITGDETCSIYDQDPLLGPLQDNGGPTFTHALLEGSPAIDAVCPDCGCTTVDGIAVTTDQRGEPRPADGDGDGTALCDMGAYELQPPPTPPIEPVPAGVPAVNHWGMVAMIALFAGLLVWTMRRRLSAS